MIRLGYVYGNLMVNLHQKNEKLVDRALRILQLTTGLGRKTAQNALRKSKNSIPLALIMLQAQVSRAEAQRALKAANGHVRRAIAAARSL